LAKSALIWAVTKRGLKPNAKLVLLHLADHARAADWKSWPGVDLLVVETGLSRRSIYDQLRNLEESGLIKRAEFCDRKRVFKLNRAVDNFSSSANNDNRVVQISTLSSANKSTSSANGDNVLLLREPIEPFLNQKKKTKKVNRPTVDKPRGDHHEQSASGQTEAAEERVRERLRRSRDRQTVESDDADISDQIP
jgi:DNA-binding transcriptional ArsR family regulator